jgi:hypothetical protein
MSKGKQRRCKMIKEKANDATEGFGNLHFSLAKYAYSELADQIAGVRINYKKRREVARVMGPHLNFGIQGLGQALYEHLKGEKLVW